MNANKTLHIDMTEQGLACSVPTTTFQLKGLQKLILASIDEIGRDEYEKQHLKAVKKLKGESFLMSAMYKQFGLLDHMAPHFTSCLVVAVSNSILNQAPLMLEGGELVVVSEKGIFEVLDNLTVAA